MPITYEKNIFKGVVNITYRCSCYVFCLSHRPWANLKSIRSFNEHANFFHYIRYVEMTDNHLQTTLYSEEYIILQITVNSLSPPVSLLFSSALERGLFERGLN